MAWTNINFVNVGDPVTLEFVNQLLENLREDDVALATTKGDLIVGNGANRGTRIPIGSPDYILQSMTAAPRMRWVTATALSGSFMTWGEVKAVLGLS